MNELDPNLEHIKIHGLQRSGTNYLTYLVNENFENANVLVNVAGWKHGPYIAPTVLGKEVHVLVIVKNPYSWLASVYNYWGRDRTRNVGPNLNGVPFADFITNKIHLEKQKTVSCLFRASNPVQYWNNMNFHWTSISLSTKRLFMIPYESLLKNKDRCLTAIGTAFGLTRKKEFSDCAHILEPAGETIRKGEQLWENECYYLEQQFQSLYDQDMLQFVNKELDLELMIGLGYDYLEVA